ncbi:MULTISPECIES: DUF2339 domain-containing protein [unclassified Ruegeria]|uniref:DUF2339 domain-containing protein n=1 Tax=unclassified Ruegeria TaxID=2625375 RepID=UPI0014889118|nr:MULTISPECIES: DUF2339 domain-containing protein [unclassified Ruegeria]NOE33631.1 DUF2339 domain-containing protein [Ruegeria sp. HKCCD7318]
MESLLVLVGLIVLAIPVTLVVLVVGQTRLRRRVADLEAQISTLSSADTVVSEGPLEKVPDPQSEAEQEPRRPAPWAAPKRPAEETLVGTADVTSSAIVFTHDRFTAFGDWLRENWFYAVSAVSLALAGIFLVQYGVENGLLPPAARVLAALGFGSILITAGEALRRKFGDDEDATTAYLPSVFSGAGLVTLFGAILAARQLYDLIGAEAALAGMVAVAVIGLVLGWFHGPLLAAVGLIGAFLAPFLVGGASEDPSWLYAYFLLVAVLGLGIDTVRRWAWVSVLTVFGAYSANLLLVAGAPNTEPGYLVATLILALLVIAIPARRVWPDHSGPMISQMIRYPKARPWPDFPTRLAAGAIAVSSAILAWHWADTETEFWLGVTLLSALVLALLLWAKDAPALQDLTVLPAVGLVFNVLMHGLDQGAAFLGFAATYAETAEADYPMVVTVLVALGALISILMAWRSAKATQFRAIWAGGAALFAPVMAIGLEVGWHPVSVIGAYPWALHAVALAVLMVVIAERFARVDGEDRMRAALATLSALSCLVFACVIVLSAAALTVALVASVVVAAALDRKFTLPPMSWFIWAGVFAVTVRLVLDPGLYWANSAPVLEMTLVYGSATVGFVAGWWVQRPLQRPVASLLLESAAWATGGILLSLLLLRWLEGFGEGGADNSHWGLGLLAVIWLLLAFAQVQRFELGGKLNYARYVLAVFFAAHGLFYLMLAVSEQNPLLNPNADPVLGLPVFNTLAIAYLLPALVIAGSAWRIKDMPNQITMTSYVVAGGLAAMWLGLTIRHVWQGSAGMFEGNGVTQPELYTYTLVLLLIGAALFYQSLARGSDLMRKAGLVVIGLAVAKVFLIDIAGLGGLIRVFSLLALGLALAGLAWLNRWAKLRHSPHEAEPLDH